jgi:hypothetical protein
MKWLASGIVDEDGTPFYLPLVLPLSPGFGEEGGVRGAGCRYFLRNIKNNQEEEK